MHDEASGSMDEGSECGDANAFDYTRTSDEEGCGLADAFRQFEAQAEKRTLELLKATDDRLFQEMQAGAEAAIIEEEGAGEEEGSFPAYVYMSDQFRMKRPPEFQHWQQNFQYLQVTGSRLLEGESMEHIQIVPTQEVEAGSTARDGDQMELFVEGHACLLDLACEAESGYEEIILCDGLMEETLEHHENAEDEVDMTSEHARYSPHATQVEEVLDALTAECFSSMVAPALTSLYESMLEKQQHSVRTAREDKEAAANRTIEEQLAFETARRLRLEQEAVKEAARIEVLAQQRQEEELKEAERREQLLKQQLEENDEEEVKIKTLAYSHTREWYQPNKKCFSHRGRQLTYLKPVLQAKESEELLAPGANAQERSPSPSTGKRGSEQAKALRKPRSTLQKPQPEWVTGGALTKDKLCDISWVKKIARPPASPPPSPPQAKGSRRRRKNENQKDDATPSAGVQLPVIARPAAPQAAPSNPLAPARKRSASPKPGQTSAPAALKTHLTSPYQVPPRLVAEGHKDRRLRSANAIQ